MYSAKRIRHISDKIVMEKAKNTVKNDKKITNRLRSSPYSSIEFNSI